MKHQTVYVPTFETGLNTSHLTDILGVWHEQKEGYFHTTEQLIELKKQWCGEAFDAGFEKCGENMIDHLIEVSKPLPDKETFLNNIKL